MGKCGEEILILLWILSAFKPQACVHTSCHCKSRGTPWVWYFHSSGNSLRRRWRDARWYPGDRKRSGGRTDLELRAGAAGGRLGPGVGVGGLLAWEYVSMVRDGSALIRVAPGCYIQVQYGILPAPPPQVGMGF